MVGPMIVAQSSASLTAWAPDLGGGATSSGNREKRRVACSLWFNPRSAARGHPAKGRFARYHSLDHAPHTAYYVPPFSVVHDEARSAGIGDLVVVAGFD